MRQNKTSKRLLKPCAFFEERSRYALRMCRVAYGLLYALIGMNALMARGRAENKSLGLSVCEQVWDL